MADLPPLKRRILDAVVPAVARWLVARMRQLEEAIPDAAVRWEVLRKALEQLGR